MLLKDAITDLIVREKVDLFLVRKEGNFDRLALKVLKDLVISFPKISFAVVFAYLPQEDIRTEEIDTIYPLGIEAVPKRFAIDYRNKWLIDRAGCAVVYVNRGFGLAARFADVAKNSGLTVVNLAEHNKT